MIAPPGVTEQCPRIRLCEALLTVCGIRLFLN